MNENINKYMNMLKRRYERTMHPSFLYRMGLVCEKHKIEDPRKYYLAASYMNYQPAIDKLNEMNIEELKEILNRMNDHKKCLMGGFNLIIHQQQYTLQLHICFVHLLTQ